VRTAAQVDELALLEDADNVLLDVGEKLELVRFPSPVEQRSRSADPRR
jgi:hypothetical protein